MMMNLWPSPEKASAAGPLLAPSAEPSHDPSHTPSNCPQRPSAAGRASTWPTPPGRHIVDLVLATDVTTTMPYVKNFEGWLVSADQKTEITAPRAMQPTW